MSNMLLRLISLTVLCITVSSTAIPAPLEERTTCSRTCNVAYNANFDKLDAPPGGISLGAQPPPTPYEGLNYTNVKVQSAPVLLSALKFRSPPNNAVVDTTDTLAGKMATLSKDYPGSKLTSFSLREFYFGCKLASGGQGNGGPAQACTLTITGTKTTGSSVQGSCTFTPVNLANLYDVPEKQCVLPSNFNNIVRAVIKVTAAQVANQVTVLYTDNFAYTTHGCC